MGFGELYAIMNETTKRYIIRECIWEYALDYMGVYVSGSITYEGMEWLLRILTTEARCADPVHKRVHKHITWRARR